MYKLCDVSRDLVLYQVHGCSKKFFLIFNVPGLDSNDLKKKQKKTHIQIVQLDEIIAF